MTSRPFRFLHASDFHLERPPGGLAELPDHLRQLFVDAPYRAAERVFDAVLKEQVDFVLLAGDVVDPIAAGPRALVFLIDQFARLNAKGIKIYWAGGRTDEPQLWPVAVALPENVHVFAEDRVEHIVHESEGQPLAEILGVSQARGATAAPRGYPPSSAHTVGQANRTPRKKLPVGEFRPTAGGLYSIAVAYGAAEQESLAAQNISYWALGGKHKRRTLQTAPSVIHYPGSPQGRRMAEAGPHGCTLVTVDDQGRTRTGLGPTDVLRFHHETVAAGDRTSRSAIERLLDERATSLYNNGLGPDLLVNWTLSGSPALAGQLRRGKLAADLLARLRADYGQKRPTLWSVSLAPDPAAELPADLYEQENILGEFLRTLRTCQQHPDQPINLAAYLAERHLDGSVASLVELNEPTTRSTVLREAARLGVDLLSPETEA